VLAEAAGIVQDLKPGAALLPRAARALDRIIVSATPVFKLTPKLASNLQAALVTVQKLASDSASSSVFKLLGANDLASFGSSAFVGLGAILKTVAPAQLACNTAGIWARNIASETTEGDSSGTWLRFIVMVNLAETLLTHSTPSADLHANPYPIENSSQCQAGNETYSGGQLIGPPAAATSTRVDDTSPPAGVLARGQAVGLVP
jgi:hypothetical protein